MRIFRILVMLLALMVSGCASIATCEPIPESLFKREPEPKRTFMAESTELDAAKFIDEIKNWGARAWDRLESIGKTQQTK